MARVGGVAAAGLGESWFLIYLFICSKNSNFKINNMQINAQFWVNFFAQQNKLKTFLPSIGLGNLIEVLGQDLTDIDNYTKFNERDAEKFFTKGKNFISQITGKKVDGGGWDDALKFQVKRFLANGAVKNATKMNVLRQESFYQKTGIKDVLSNVIKMYGFGGTLDRWNPADVWFYTDIAERKIKDYLKNTNGFYVTSMRDKNMSLGIEAITGLNDLILNLYDSKDLYPVSLKKASFNKYKGRDEKNSKASSYTFRLAAINDPRKDVKGRPNDPKIVEKSIPIQTYGSKQYIAGGGKNASGIPKLSYTIEVDQVIYNNKGEKSYVREFNYLSYESSKTSMVANPQKRYKEAAAGSLGIENINQIIYTPQVASKLRQIRHKIEKMVQGDIVNASGSAQVGNNKEEKSENALTYFDFLCQELQNNIKDRQIVLAKSTKNQKDFAENREHLTQVQNELEILFAIEKADDPIELVFDLWKAAVGKGQTGRKVHFDNLVKTLQRTQKMKKEDAEREAESLLSANTPVAIKIPSSFHLKLY